MGPHHLSRQKRSIAHVRSEIDVIFEWDFRWESYYAAVSLVDFCGME